MALAPDRLPDTAGEVDGPPAPPIVGGSAFVETDQEHVAQIISKYDLLAVPVVGKDGLLAGIVTVDDVVDVLIGVVPAETKPHGAVNGGERDVQRSKHV